jgi:hypothetical protein
MTPEEALRNILILVDGSDGGRRSRFADTFAEHQDLGREGVGALPIITLRIFSSAPAQLAPYRCEEWLACRDYPI